MSLRTRWIRKSLQREEGQALVLACIMVLILSLGSGIYVAANFPDTPRILVPFAEYLENIRAIRAWYTRGADLPQFLFGLSHSLFPCRPLLLASYLLRFP